MILILNLDLGHFIDTLNYLATPTEPVSQWIFCQSQILQQKLWGGASESGVMGGASGYGVRASGYGVGASGYGSLVIIVSAQSKELGF